MRNVLSALVEACDRTNRPDEAAKWRGELSLLDATSGPATSPATAPTGSQPARDQ
jgi:hypothetical protein